MAHAQDRLAKATATPLSSSLVYEPLEKTSKEIRLIEILPATDGRTSLECRLLSARLEDRPKYIALSYCWGDETDLVDTTVNGIATSIKANLASALLHLRDILLPRRKGKKGRKGIPQLFWVDALCINQQDIPERNHQVALMASIYQKAHLVISWLGGPSETMSLAFRTLNLFAEMQKITRGPGLDWSENTHAIWEETDKSSGPCFNSLRQFYFASYWDRAWVLQEAVFARRLWLMCGPEILPWSNLQRAHDMFQQYQNRQLSVPSFVDSSGSNWTELLNLDLWKIDLIKRRRKQWHSTRSLESLSGIADTWHLHVTDARDKVYSLLGLYCLDIVPDYSLSAEEVYSQLARSFIESLPDTEIFRFSGITFENLISKEAPWDSLSLPSWIPNWKGLAWIMPEELFSYSAFLYEANLGMKDTAINAEILDDNSVCLNGVLFDKITSVQQKEPLEGSWGRLAKSWATFAPEGNGRTYNNGRSLLHVIFRTLTFDMTLDKSHRLLEDPKAMDELGYIFLSFLIPTSDDFAHAHGIYQYEKGYVIQNYLTKDSQHLEYEDVRRNMKKIAELGAIWNSMRYQCIFLTLGNFIGIAPPGIQEGDMVCVLAKCRFPVVLRRQGSHFVHVGPCFVLGLMDGEAAEMVNRGEREMEWFEIH